MGNNETIGGRLAMCRMNLGLGQSSFAELIECEPEALIAYEEDSCLPERAVLRQIALNFNISPNWIMTGEGDPYIDDEEEQALMAEEEAARVQTQAAPVSDAARTKAQVIAAIEAMDDEAWQQLCIALQHLFSL